MSSQLHLSPQWAMLSLPTLTPALSSLRAGSRPRMREATLISTPYPFARLRDALLLLDSLGALVYNPFRVSASSSLHCRRKDEAPSPQSRSPRHSDCSLE